MEYSHLNPFQSKRNNDTPNENTDAYSHSIF
jgi:hypothetical protein